MATCIARSLCAVGCGQHCLRTPVMSVLEVAVVLGCMREAFGGMLDSFLKLCRAAFWGKR